jgi:hypothetical protein
MNLTPTLKEFPLGALRNPAIDLTFPAQGLEELRINMPVVGSLMICFDAIDDARVVAAGDAHLLPQLVERVNNTLVLESRSSTVNLSDKQRQKLLIEVHVPYETRLNAHMKAGVIMLKGGAGDVSIDGMAGEITGVTFAQNVDVRLQAGDVNFNDLSGKTNIHVSAGNISLGWEKLTGREVVNLSCGFGAIDLRLPPENVKESDTGGLMQHKTLRLPNGSHIHAKVNFGALEVTHWKRKRSGGAMISI